MNIYRMLGDLCLISSTPIFVYKALKYGSNDLSLVTQFLRLLMFCTRYVDIFTVFISPYNTFLKCFLVISTLILVLILTWQKLNNHGSRGLGPAVGLTTVTIVNCFFVATWANYNFTLMEILWSFSRFVNAFAETHQLSMIYNMEKLDAYIIAYYLTVFGRAVFYAGNWVYRYLTEGLSDPISAFSTTLEVCVIAVYIIPGIWAKRECALHNVDSKRSAQVDEPPSPVDQKIPFIIIEEVA